MGAPAEDEVYCTGPGNTAAAAMAGLAQCQALSWCSSGDGMDHMAMLNGAAAGLYFVALRKTVLSASFAGGRRKVRWTHSFATHKAYARFWLEAAARTGADPVGRAAPFKGMRARLSSGRPPFEADMHKAPWLLGRKDTGITPSPQTVRVAPGRWTLSGTWTTPGQYKDTAALTTHTVTTAPGESAQMLLLWPDGGWSMPTAIRLQAQRLPECLLDMLYKGCVPCVDVDRSWASSYGLLQGMGVRLPIDGGDYAALLPWERRTLKMAADQRLAELLMPRRRTPAALYVGHRYAFQLEMSANRRRLYATGHLRQSVCPDLEDVTQTILAYTSTDTTMKKEGYSSQVAFFRSRLVPENASFKKFFFNGVTEDDLFNMSRQ